jgi:hypothetical protein
MAHKKGQGSSRNGRDSPGQRRGVKSTPKSFPGNIIIRQLTPASILESMLAWEEIIRFSRRSTASFGTNELVKIASV